MASNEGSPAACGDRAFQDALRGDLEHPEGTSDRTAGQGYPHQPGWRRGPNAATSREAAEVAARQAAPLKERVLHMLAEGPASPEELQAKFAEAGERILLNTLRARCS